MLPTGNAWLGRLLAKLFAQHKLQTGPHVGDSADLDIDEAQRKGEFTNESSSISVATFADFFGQDTHTIALDFIFDRQATRKRRRSARRVEKM